MLVAVVGMYAFGLAGTGEAGMIVGLGLMFGTVATAPGSPDHTYATGSGEIPVLFANKTVEEFYDVSVAPFVANSDYEGMIKKQGDTVVINTLPDIAMSRYTQNSSINWQTLAGGKVELKVDRAQYFAIKLDNITLAQLADKQTLDKFTKHGSETMREAIDTEFLADIYLEADASNQGLTAGARGHYNLGVTGTPAVINKANVTEYIARCAGVASDQKWPKSGRWMVIPTWMKYLLNTSELKDAGVTGAASSFMVNGGYFKTLYDFDIYESTHFTAVSDSGLSCDNIVFGHKSGITFATQLTEMKHFEKFENTIGEGMRALTVYDWKVVKPESVGVLYARLG
jgi:hypothetical protein